jgi:ribosomal protein S18 acetylase RimI-like enzyme
MRIARKMTISLELSSDIMLLVRLLHDADEDDARIQRLGLDGRHQFYLARSDEQLVGAAMLCWETAVPGESEIEYIAIVREQRRCGYGRQLIARLIAEARARGIKSLLVGTDNTALDTIAFYQRCGFRMDHVRHDFFSYIQPPLISNGIPLRDMLVLRYACFE